MSWKMSEHENSIWKIESMARPWKKEECQLIDGFEEEADVKLKETLLFSSDFSKWF